MDIADLQHLAGIRNKFTGYTPYMPENLSIPGTEKAKIQRKKKIQPGTDEWFKLWFSKPHLTGERPTDWKNFLDVYGADGFHIITFM